MEKKWPLLDAPTFLHFRVFVEFGSVSKEWGKKKNANVCDYEILARSLGWPASVAVF